VQCRGGAQSCQNIPACHAETIVDLPFRPKRGCGVTGHRGSRATHPENSIAGFRFAIESGADAIELDIVITTDGKLAVRHDPVDVPLARLPASVPTLDAALATGTGNDIIFDIEAKTCGALTPPPHEYAQLILDSVDRAGMARRVMIRSFEHSILRACDEIRPEIPLVALTAKDAAGWAEVSERARARAISPWARLVSSREVAHAHEAGLVVIPWTVNTRRGWGRLIGMGVDWIVTDRPASLVQYLAG
jgi:glycerophosphoryl diester phosphodiesterase